MPGIKDRNKVKVGLRKVSKVLKEMETKNLKGGTVFIPFHFRDATATIARSLIHCARYLN